MGGEQVTATPVPLSPYRSPGIWAVKKEEKWEHPTSPKITRKVVCYCTATTLSLFVARSS